MQGTKLWMLMGVALALAAPALGQDKSEKYKAAGKSRERVSEEAAEQADPQHAEDARRALERAAERRAEQARSRAEEAYEALGEEHDASEADKQEKRDAKALRKQEKHEAKALRKQEKQAEKDARMAEKQAGQQERADLAGEETPGFFGRMRRFFGWERSQERMSEQGAAHQRATQQDRGPKNLEE